MPGWRRCLHMPLLQSAGHYPHPPTFRSARPPIQRYVVAVFFDRSCLHTLSAHGETRTVETVDWGRLRGAAGAIILIILRKDFFSRECRRRALGVYTDLRCISTDCTLPLFMLCYLDACTLVAFHLI